MEKETIGYVEVVSAAFLWGFLPIAVRFGQNLGAYNLSFFRVVVAAMALLAFSLLMRGYRIVGFKHERWKLLLFGALHGFIILGYFYAIQYLSITSAVLLLYSSSIWMVVFSILILKEKPTMRNIFSIILAFVGLVLITLPDLSSFGVSFIATIAGLLAGVGAALVYILSKTFKKYDKVSLTFWQNLIAIPFLLPLVFIQPPSFTLRDIGLVLVIGIFMTAVPFVLVYRGFQKIPASKGAVVMLMEMVFPIAIALIIFREIPTIYSAIGGLLIIIGCYIVTSSK